MLLTNRVRKFLVDIDASEQRAARRALRLMVRGGGLRAAERQLVVTVTPQIRKTLMAITVADLVAMGIVRVTEPTDL